MVDPKELTDDQWRQKLSPEQYQVLREGGTERAFTGKYEKNKAAGQYRCAGCGQVLFESDTKYDSGSGWPSFTAPASEGAVVEHRETDGERHLAVGDGGRETVDEELVDRHAPLPVLAADDHLRAGGQRRRRPVAGGIVVTQAPDDRRHLPHDGIGDDAGHVVEQAPARVANPRGALDRDVAGGRADRQRAVRADVVQLANGVDVDEHGRPREAEPHRWHEALPACQDPGVGPVFLQGGEGLIGRTRPDVVEGCGDHRTNLLSSRGFPRVEPHSISRNGTGGASAATAVRRALLVSAGGRRLRTPGTRPSLKP